jgi:hypothetical protein
MASTTLHDSVVSGSSNFKRAELSINLKCAAGERIDLKSSYKTATNGVVKLYWNGVELQNMPEYLGCPRYYNCADNGNGLAFIAHNSSYSGTSYWVNTAQVFPGGGILADPGDNELTFVFERTDVMQPSSVTGAATRIYRVTKGFADCEDLKVCLGQAGLGGEWRTQAAKDLRNSILLQQRCLEDETMPGYTQIAGVCARWKSCLTGQGKVDTVRNILEAFGASAAPPLPQFSSGRRLLQSGNQARCRDPFIMDPESWDCACHARMLELCSDSASFTTCYRNLLCSASDVCQSWKTAVGCPGAETALLEGAFDSEAPYKTTSDVSDLLEMELGSRASAGWNCG